MLTDGTTISTFSGPSSRIASSASFSQASSTSPISRCTNVLVAPRAPLSSTGARLYMSATNFCAAACAAATSFAAAGSSSLRQIAVQLTLQLRAPRRKVVPARAARSLRIRRHDGDTGEITLDDPEDPVPYWLVSTRHPQQLAEALREAASSTLTG